MHGVIFYWVGWVLWIIVTFLMDKKRERLPIAVWLLILIACSHTDILAMEYHLNVSTIVLFFGAIIALTRTDRWMLYMFSAMCVVFGYLGILIWEQVSPVWMFIPRIIMIPVTMFILLSLLNSSYWIKITIWCLGAATGEIIYSFILGSYGFNEFIGEKAFLDIVMTEVGIILVFHLLQKLKMRIESVLLAIEKQKNEVQS